MTPGGGAEVNTTLPFVLGGLSCFCCSIFGFIPLYIAYQAHQAKGQGDMATATAKAGLATKVAGAMIAVGLVLQIVGFIANVAMNS
jgi:hypothetical protein